MGDLDENTVIEREYPLEFGDSEAAKFASVLHDHKEYVDCSLLQTVKIEKVNRWNFNGQERNHVRLGPCFKPEKVEEALESLKDCLPAKFTKPPYLNEPEKLVCHWVRSSNKPTNGWTCSIDTKPWFNRLSSRHESWRKLRIYEFLKLSTYPRFPFYDALTAGLVCCWNPCLNVFITGQGFRTITLEDIAFITGLSPTGITLPTQSLIDGALDLEKIHPWKNKSNMPFSSIADYYNPARNKSLPADISRKEEALFINFAFCKMMMFPSCNVNKTFLKLAANIEASGSKASDVKPLRLGPLFLGQVYRCLYRLRIQEKLYTAGGPVWIISLWGLFYFPFLAKEKANARLDYEELEAEFDKPTFLPVNECCCYGEVAIHSVSPVVHLSFEEVLRGLLSPSELSQSDWHPFSGDEKGIPLYLHDAKGSLVEDTSGEWMKKAAPVWLLDLSCMNIREEDQSHWLSLLQPRDLMCIEPKVIGVEAYNPNLVARQFGMTQGLGIPYYKTLNRPWGTRPNILEITPKSGDNKNTVAETWLKSVCSGAVSSNQISPWFKWPAVDSGYELWWVYFFKRCQTSWSDAIVTLVQHVQGLPRINRTLSTTPVSAGPNRKIAGAQTTIVSSPSKALSQMDSAQASPMTRGQIRKTGKTMGDTSEEKATIEDAEEPDEAILTLFQHVQRLPRSNRSLSTAQTPPSPGSTSPRARTTIVAGLSKTLSEMVNSAKRPPVPRGQKRKTEITLGADTSSSKKATTEMAGDSDDDIPLRTLQRRAIRPHHAVPAKSLNNGEVQRDTNMGMNPSCQTLEAEAPHTAPDFPENLGTISSEEAVVETVTLEAEDSLEPPHEMVLGMGSSSLDATCSIPSEDLYDECPDLQAVNPSCSSSLRAEDVASVKGEPMEEEYGAEDPASPDDTSRALIGRSSHPDTSLTLAVPEGVSYTPDKALAEVNSVVALIEDTLRPFPVPSAFDAEKEKAEEIVGILQSNVRELATYANLSEQIHKLLVVSPPQFRPILAHYQTSFLSLRDQLRNIREQEDSMAYQAEALLDLSTVAKELRDRLQISQERIDQLRTHCSQYDEEINELEAKLLILKQLRESKLQELSTEEQKFDEFSSTWSDTIPSLQKVAQTMVSAHQTKAQRECTLKTINDNVQSFVGLLKTM